MRDEDEMDNNTWFFCRDCGWSTGVHKTMDEAIKAWNGISEQSTDDSEQGEGNGCGRAVKWE